MSKWLNTKTIINPDIVKPCIKLQYCPYGQLIEEYPHHYDPKTKTYPKISCATVNGAIIQFGHDCPIHYLAELIEKEPQYSKPKTRKPAPPQKKTTKKKTSSK